VLDKLKAIHQEQREAVASLAAILSHPDRDGDALAAARLVVMRINRRRLSLIDCAILPLLPDAGPADARALSELRLETATHAIRMSQHITRWTLTAICSDWDGYKRASAEMRREVLRRLDREAEVLYPLLTLRETAVRPACPGVSTVGMRDHLGG